MINSEREWDWMNNAISIEEILTEANAYSLRAEVKATAEAFIKDDPDMDVISAYNIAFIEWVK